MKDLRDRREYFKKRRLAHLEEIRAKDRASDRKRTEQAKETKRRWNEKNKDKLLPYYREYYKKNKAKAQASKLLKNYGLTTDAYNELLSNQNRSMCYM